MFAERPRPDLRARARTCDLATASCRRTSPVQRRKAAAAASIALARTYVNTGAHATHNMQYATHKTGKRAVLGLRFCCGRAQAKKQTAAGSASSLWGAHALQPLGRMVASSRSPASPRIKTGPNLKCAHTRGRLTSSLLRGDRRKTGSARAPPLAPTRAAETRPGV